MDKTANRSPSAAANRRRARWLGAFNGWRPFDPNKISLARACRLADELPEKFSSILERALGFLGITSNFFH